MRLLRRGTGRRVGAEEAGTEVAALAEGFDRALLDADDEFLHVTHTLVDEVVGEEFDIALGGNGVGTPQGFHDFIARHPEGDMVELGRGGGATGHPGGGGNGGGEDGDPADRSVHAPKDSGYQMAAVCRVCDKRATNGERIRYRIVASP